MTDVELKTEIREIKTAVQTISDGQVAIVSDLGDLKTAYAELSERVRHPCEYHGGMADRLARLEGCKAGRNGALATGQSTVRLWLAGIAVAVSCLTAIIIAILK